jgi:glycosyltransferase involved in cell wall biosynthesis
VRILVCSGEAPLPPPNGFRLALSSVLEQLRVRHEVRVIAFRLHDQDESASDDPAVRIVPRPPRGPLRDVARLGRALALRRPVGVDASAAALREPLREELERFQPDVVHVTPGRLAALAGDLAGQAAVLVALDAWHVNVEAEAQRGRGLRSRFLGGEAKRIRRFEASEYRRFDGVVVVSDEDAAALTSLDPRIRVEVIPNGVDADRFAPEEGVSREPGRIVFTGVMDYAPNVAAAEFLARRVFPLVRSRRPEARLAIVGRDPTPEVRDLAAEGVEVTGEVPDLRPWLARSRVYACPMVSGTGIKNKLLEAMASELACVATPLALQGLAAEPGVHLLVGETAEQLAEQIVRLLDEADEAEQLGRAAREYVLANHDWRTVAAAYERVYEEATPEPGGH